MHCHDIMMGHDTQKWVTSPILKLNSFTGLGSRILPDNFAQIQHSLLTLPTGKPNLLTAV